MIKVLFKNGTNTVELKHVRSVEWAVDSSDDALVNLTSRTGKRTRTVTINGFINKAQFTPNLNAQLQLEADLIQVGVGTIEIAGNTDIQQARFLGLTFQEFRGNPVLPFKITFKTEEDNIHAHTPIKIGTLTLEPASGYEYANVKESIQVQGPDEPLVGTLNRAFTVSGTIVDSTLSGINQKQQAIVAEIQNVANLVLTLSANSGAYVALFTVRPRKIDFSAPKLKGDLAAREFTLEFITHEDYLKEPYVLGEVPLPIGSPAITIDVVEQYDHNKEIDKSSTGTQTLLSETLTVSGVKHFANYTAYLTFQLLFSPIPFNVYGFASSTSNVLDLTDIQIGKFERNGNFPDTSKRYSATVTLTYSWQKPIQQTNFHALTTLFGITFFKVPTITFGVAVDSAGSITSRTLSLNGEVKGTTQFNNLRALLGTAVTYDATFSNLYVTSVNVGEVTAVNDAGVQVILYKVSLTAAQLDTAGQAAAFIRGLFRMDRSGGAGTSYSADTIQFENITSLTKSVSNRFNAIANPQKFIVTSISLSVSGDVYEPDLGGKPMNPNRIILLFNKIDALLTAEKSTQSAPNTVPTGELLPTNSNIFYLLNNFSVSQWQPAVALENIPGIASKGARYWRQNVSLSATAVFDLAGSSNSEPDFVDSRSTQFDLQTPRFTQIQVAGFGTVFKRIGTNPEKATVTHQRQYRSLTVYSPSQYGFDNNPPTPTGWAGSANSVVVKETKESRNLMNRWTKEFEATQSI